MKSAFYYCECGTKVPQSKRYCPKCGADRHEEHEEEPSYNARLREGFSLAKQAGGRERNIRAADQTWKIVGPEWFRRIIP